MSDETMDRIAAIVREAMDYAADHGRITTAEDYADRIREALATPAAGEDVLERALDVVDFLHGAGPLDGRWLHERPAGAGPYWWRWYLAEIRAALLRTPSGEGEAVRVPAEVERPCDCAGCYCGNVGDAEEVGYADGWNACRDAMLAALRSAPTGVEEGEAVATVARMIADAPVLGNKRDLARQILAYLRAAPVPARKDDAERIPKGLHWLAGEMHEIARRAHGSGYTERAKAYLEASDMVNAYACRLAARRGEGGGE